MQCLDKELSKKDEVAVNGLSASVQTLMTLHVIATKKVALCFMHKVRLASMCTMSWWDNSCQFFQFLQRGLVDFKLQVLQALL